jgi:hypothetical protein
MATESVKRCDVFDTKGDVRTYDVQINEIKEGGEPAHTPFFFKSLDLSPRALERLKGFVERGIKKPGAKTE